MIRSISSCKDAWLARATNSNSIHQGIAAEYYTRDVGAMAVLVPCQTPLVNMLELKCSFRIRSSSSCKDEWLASGTNNNIIQIKASRRNITHVMLGLWQCWSLAKLHLFTCVNSNARSGSVLARRVRTHGSPVLRIATSFIKASRGNITHVMLGLWQCWSLAKRHLFIYVNSNARSGSVLARRVMNNLSIC
jgi:hypothetical protein